MDYIKDAVAMLDRAHPSYGLVDSKPEMTGEIAYTQSQVVKLDNKHLQKNHILTPESDKVVVNAYKLLRTRILQLMQQNGWVTLGITSPGPDEGKTLTAINLAISMAMKLDYTVLLVDLDFRKPSISERFGFQAKYGLGDYLAGKVKLEEVFVNPGINRLLLLPEKEARNNSSEILSSTGMERMVDELKNRYQSRIIIFDLPPVLVGDDVLAFSGLVDATLLVTQEGKTTTDDLNKTVSLLENKNVVGAVLNRSSVKNEFSNYGY
ncbi:CpsD/CapB family tyrosine-protein kinase [Thiogranum longum]|nr:CpsD/CapB family tyrosine-protein kinase [Thiogranum longum]